MNWDQIEGKWKQMKGSAKKQWGKLTDGDLDQIAGQQEQLLGKLQERYGIAREEAKKRCDEWMKSMHEAESHEMAGHSSGAGRKR
jgi:uncharacterized protein YjbJ (UPF0337 family)